MKNMRWNLGLFYWIIKSKLEEMTLRENGTALKSYLFNLYLASFLNSKSHTPFNMAFKRVQIDHLQ